LKRIWLLQRFKLYVDVEMQERRRFIKGFGLLGLALSGAAAASKAVSNTGVIGVGTGTNNVPAVIDPPVVEDIAHLAPLGIITLQLTADNTPPPPPPPPVESFEIHKNEDGSWLTTGVISGSSYPPILNDGYKETDNRVTLSVGKDNRLWIKIGDTWRRVALEG